MAKSHRKFPHCAHTAIGLALVPTVCIVGLVLGVAGFGYLKAAHKCVPLGNGLHVGYNALLDVRNSYFRPRVVVKFDDGKPLIDDKLWSLFFNDTAVYGHTFGKHRRRQFSFYWNARAGLVERDDDPARYDGLVADAGLVNPGLGDGDYGTGVIRDLLKVRPDYGEIWCQTRLIAW